MRVLALSFLIHTWTADCFQLSIIEVMVGDNPIYGRSVMGPALDVTFESLKSVYPHLFTKMTRKRIQRAGSISCLDAAGLQNLLAGEIWTEIERSQGFPVVISSGCSLEVLVQGDIARELEYPLLAIIAGDPRLVDKRRYPTTTTFGPVDQGQLVEASNKLCDTFNWRSFTLICDTVSQYTAMSTFYILTCALHRARLLERKFDVKMIYIDSGKSVDYAYLLRKVKMQSRIVYIFTHPDIIRQFMVHAAMLNMTNGEYVFLASQITTTPQLTEIEWRQNKTDDLLAKAGMQSLVYFRNPNPNWDNLLWFTAKYWEKAQVSYNVTFHAHNKYNDLFMAAYETILSMVKILNETYQIQNLSALGFASIFRNRSISLPSRTVYINNGGMRQSDVEFYKLNLDTDSFENVWRYDSVRKVVLQTTASAERWLGGSPPPDTPYCGYDGQRCVESSGTLVTAVAAGVSAAVVVIGIIVGCQIRKYISLASINVELLIFEENSQHMDGLNPITDKKGLDNAVNFVTRAHNGEQVWLRILACKAGKSQLLADPTFRKALLLMRQTHPCLTMAHGLSLFPGVLAIIYEFPQRGSFRLFLSSEIVQSEQKLTCSIIWDIVDGINFIHHSALKMHGLLTPDCIFINSRFHAKISDQLTSRFCNLLSIQAKPIGTVENDLASVYSAPEAKSDAGYASPQSDIFSLSSIIEELCFEKASLNEPLHRLLDSGTSKAASDRPTIRQFASLLAKCLPRVDVMRTILKSLEEQASRLEDIVLERTLELKTEQSKTDTLLSSMIPRQFIDSLRNKLVPPAEQFDSVTIMFSGFPEFGLFCVKATPFQVTIFLNEIYTRLDESISKFDVYKVETIGGTYVVASGLPKRNEDRHAEEIAKLALQFMTTNKQQLVDSPSTTLKMQIGFHSGPCAAGIVGMRAPRYCLFGDTINTASRMMSTGEVLRIQLSSGSHKLLSGCPFSMVQRGEIVVKGKGTLKTWNLSEY